MLARAIPIAALLLVAALLTNVGSASAAPGDATADRVFGQGGSFTSGTCNLPASPDTNLCTPWGVTVDTGGRLYVSDTNNDRVLIYNNPLGSSVATQIIGVGAGGYPYGIALDSGGRLYVAVSGSRVFEYDTPLTSSVVSRTIALGAGTYAQGIAVDTGGRLYIADAYFSRILILDTPLTSSVVNHNISTGSGSVPTGVALDAAGHLFVADAGNHRILEYDNPLTSSVANRVIGQPGFGLGTCNNGGLDAGSLCGPIGLAVGSGGSLYAAEGNNRVLQYNDPLGSCATCDVNADTVFGQGGSFTTNVCNNGGRSAASLCNPQGVAVSANGHLWVADGNNNRVLQYDGQGCAAAPIPVTGPVPPGGTLSTDPTGAGATACQTLQVSVTTPNGGTVTITTGPSSGSPLIGRQAQIIAPAATAASPLVLAFTIDASLVPPGQDQNNLQVFKNGTFMFDCSSLPGVAGPDPCVMSRALVPGGDVKLVVLSSTASTWTFGPYTPVGGTVLLPSSRDSAGGGWLWPTLIGGLALVLAATLARLSRRYS